MQALPAHASLARWLDAPVDWEAEFEADLDDLQRLIEWPLAGGSCTVTGTALPVSSTVAGTG